MNQPLEIYTFGGLTIQRDHTPVTGFVSRKVDALLVYLALEPREHSREFLAEFLWDNLPQVRSQANLRMALSSLQQQLAPYVLVTRQSVSINPENALWIDASVLNEALSKAEHIWMRTGRLPRVVVQELDRALKLYRGDFLAGFHLRDSQDFDDWRLMEQERLRTRVITTLRRLVEQFLERGAYAEGIEYAARLLQLDPLREETHRQLMRLQVGSGERSAAAAQYKSCQQLLQKELGVEPDIETTTLYQQILQGTVEIVPPVLPPKHNLPFSSTPYVERAAEEADLSERLDSADCRLLSLVGSGGTGKTRLAIHAALERVEDYQDGVYLVTFTSVDSGQYLIPPIAAALKLRTGEDAKQDLIDSLRDKHMLLVLDNFEYVMDGVSVIDELINQTQWLKLMVTSRERLNLQQEWVLPIGGLDCPPSDEPDQLEYYGAVRLFTYAARRVNAHFSLAQNAKGIKRVCDLVEGMPLGLELASGWTSVMSVAQIAAQIEQSLGFLETSQRNVPQRHRSIRTLFEHTWSMLTEVERGVMMRLSTFQSRFSLEAAQTVGQMTPPILLALAEKSLVRSETEETYNLHQLLRRYAGEKLEQSGESETALEAHALYFAERLEKDVEVDQFVRIFDYYEDVRAALHWTLDHRRIVLLLRLSAKLAGFWQRTGAISEGRQWLAQALRLADETVPPALRANALQAAGVLAWRQGDFDEARDSLQRALMRFREVNALPAIASTLTHMGYINMNVGDHEAASDCFDEILQIGRSLDDQELIGTALANMGLVAHELADHLTAKRYLEEALTIAETLPSNNLIAVVLSNLGAVEIKLDHYDLAERHYEASLAYHRANNSRINMAIALVNLAEAAHYQHKLENSAAHYHEGLTLLWEIGDKLSLIQTLEFIAFLIIDQHRAEVAARLLGAAHAQREVLGTPIIPRERERYDMYSAAARKQIGDSAFEAELAAMRTQSLDQAVEFALAIMKQI